MQTKQEKQIIDIVKDCLSRKSGTTKLVITVGPEGKTTVEATSNLSLSFEDSIEEEDDDAPAGLKDYSEPKARFEAAQPEEAPAVLKEPIKKAEASVETADFEEPLEEADYIEDDIAEATPINQLPSFEDMFQSQDLASPIPETTKEESFAETPQSVQQLFARMPVEEPAAPAVSKLPDMEEITLDFDEEDEIQEIDFDAIKEVPETILPQAAPAPAPVQPAAAPAAPKKAEEFVPDFSAAAASIGQSEPAQTPAVPSLDELLEKFRKQ